MNHVSTGRRGLPVSRQEVEPKAKPRGPNRVVANGIEVKCELPWAVYRVTRLRGVVTRECIGRFATEAEADKFGQSVVMRVDDGDDSD